MARLISGRAQRDRAAASAIRARRPAGIRASPFVSFPHPPIEIGTHARPQLRHLVDRVGADRERAQVEITGRPGRAPACIFALGGDQLNLNGDAAVTKRRYTHPEAVTDLQALDQILTQVEVDPQVAKIDQGDQRHAGRHVFARLNVTLIDLRGDRRVHRHLIDDGLYGFDIGYRLADVRFGYLVFFLRVAVDRLLVGGLRLIKPALALVQGIGGLVEPRNRCVAVLRQLARALESLLRQNDVRLRPLLRGLARSNDLRARADADVRELRLGDDFGCD